ncbi:MAG: CO dehydrogenase/acetyl-CoA synthase complex subunit epsilon [Candidatus Helarchaeota archaeon]
MIKIFKIKPWRPTHINGPIAGTPVYKPEIIGKIIKKAKRPLLIVGGYEYDVDIGNGKTYLDLLVELVKKKKIPVVATTEVAKTFVEKDIKPVAIMSVSNVIHRVCDENWKGFDGKGHYDWVIIAAMVYYLQSQMFSAMKHFSYKWSKGISLDRYFQPNASFCLANFKVEEWKKAINDIVKLIME